MECLEGEDTFNKHLRVDCPNQDQFISRQFMIMPHVFICIYIYSIYDEGNEALHSVGFQVHDGGSSVQDPRDTSRTLVAWQVGAANLVPRICTPRFIGLSIIPGYCRVPKVNQLCLCGDCWCIMVYLYGTIWQLWLLCALNHGVAIVKHDRTDSVPIAPSDWIL